MKTTFKEAGTVARFIRSMKEQGLRRTLQSGISIADDWLFDWRFGTDTVTRVYQIDLSIIHPKKNSAHPYIPTRGMAFRKLMKSLDLPRGSVFVDYGSGKGKVLLLASLFRFQRVVGIEYSEELHAVALKNLAKFKARARGPAIESVCMDASEYRLADDENVLYFFNPFERDVLLGCLSHIKESLERRPRGMVVIYFDPLFQSDFDEYLNLKVMKNFVYGGYEAVVMSN